MGLVPGYPAQRLPRQMINMPESGGTQNCHNNAKRVDMTT